MAEKKTDETEDQAPGAKGSRSKKKWILLILILLLVLGGGAGAAYYFFVYKTAGETPTAVDEVTESGEAAPVVTARTPLIYHGLESFTANLAAPGPVRFLRVAITIVTPDQKVVDAVDKHMPVIRNDLLSLLSSQEFASMNTPEGKDALRETLKETIVGVLTGAGAPAGVTDVLFTDFVMQ